MENKPITFQASIDKEQLEMLKKKYGDEKVSKLYNITKRYSQKIISNAKLMLNEANKIDEGQLINSIKGEMIVTNKKIIGQVNAGTKYARFVHEGTKHEGSKIVKHFVPFKKAKGLWIWLVRNKVVYEKTPSRGNKTKKGWYFKGKNGKEYKVDKYKGGFMVKNEPVKFFEEPYNKLKDKYLEDVKRIMIN